jgi:Na+/H+ antiporter NhaA
MHRKRTVEDEMALRWGRQIPNLDASGGVILPAIVSGKTIAVYVSAEAKDDFGIPACQDVAEEKIRLAGLTGLTPNQVEVTATDFA